MTGNDQSTANCFLYRRTPDELAAEEDAEKLIAIEKSTKVHHFMTSFTAEMGHMQIVLDALDGAKKNAAYECISAV